MDLASALAALLLVGAGLLVGLAVGLSWRRSGGAEVRQAVDEVVERAAVAEGLDRLADQVRDLAHQGASWQSQLREQVIQVRHSTDLLRRETSTLSTALRKPQVRGRWGELHLRRSVELAGLVDRCDFAEQVPMGRTDGETDRALVPDLVVHLAGGRRIVVDSKVPLDAFLDATGVDADGEPERYRHHLARHARQLRTHAEQLGAKGYWRALDPAPEFVVLFVPGESFLSAALEAEPDLIERAAERHVVLATPTTLIALLRTVAMGWSQATLAERTHEIQVLGRDLHGRLSVMGEHLDRLGRALRGATEAYNRTVGSLETRVLVSARQLSDLGVVEQPGLPAPGPVEVAPRALSAAELLEHVAPRDDPLSELARDSGTEVGADPWPERKRA